MNQHEHELPSVVKYQTTLKSCDCPDSRFRTHRAPCKHRRALMDAAGIVLEWQAKHGRDLLEEWTVIIR